MAGLLTRGSKLSRTFPGHCSTGPSGIHRGCSPLTVAGAVTDLAPFRLFLTVFPFHLAAVFILQEPSSANLFSQVWIINTYLCLWSGSGDRAHMSEVTNAASAHDASAIGSRRW